MAVMGRTEEGASITTQPLALTKRFREEGGDHRPNMTLSKEGTKKRSREEGEYRTSMTMNREDTNKRFREGTMKRFREEVDYKTNFTMAKEDTRPKCLMLFPTREAEYETNVMRARQTHSVSTSGRLYECKTCQRKFHSFQALGGHRASHKKPRLNGDDKGFNDKMHRCSICGEEFMIGQALGGHMRRHRNVIAEQDSKLPPPPTISKSEVKEKCFDLNMPPPGLDDDLEQQK